MRSKHRVFGRRPRRRRWPWLAIVLGGIAGAVWGLLPLRGPAPPTGIGQPLNYRPIGDLPDWAREAVQAQAIAPDYQLVATLVDLNRDEQLEILVAPAPPRPDVFIPDLPLHVVRYEDGAWQAAASPRSCRPARLGSFLTAGYWDLPCRDGGRRVLRWNGRQYAAT